MTMVVWKIKFTGILQRERVEGGSLNLVEGSKKIKQGTKGGVEDSYHYFTFLSSAINNIYMLVILKTLENKEEYHIFLNKKNFIYKDILYSN